MNRHRLPGSRSWLEDGGMAALESGLALAAILAVVLLALAHG